jgi:dnd system-associated protein 4
VSSDAEGRDTVNIEKNVHEVYQRLTEGNDPQNAPFRSMKDLFMWAASLGHMQGKRLPLSGKREVIFRWAQFSDQIDVPLLYAFALNETAELNVLTDQNMILTIAEEYANAGINEIKSVVLDTHGQPLSNLIELILNLKTD